MFLVLSLESKGLANYRHIRHFRQIPHFCSVSHFHSIHLFRSFARILTPGEIFRQICRYR